MSDGSQEMSVRVCVRRAVGCGAWQVRVRSDICRQTGG